jgi:hypothetical protein
MNTTTRTWAVYQRFHGQPTRVLYSHLTEQQAEDEAERLNGHCAEQGLPAGAWAEQHHPEAVFVIG